MTGLQNLNQENHDLKQELESAIGVLTTLEENIKNQSQQLKEMKDELKESKAREEDQNQKLKELQDALEKNKDQSRPLKVLQDELKELKAKDLQIRLVQNDSLHAFEGRLEIFYDGEWGTVCDDNWDDNDATVVCRMLGFSYGMATTKASFGEGSGRIVLDEVDCQGHESRLDNCKYVWRRHDCGHNEDAGVICKHETSPDVRLHFELLEISHNGIWGSVCTDSFGTTEATVACRMLEYRYGYTRKARVARVGILFENVNCKGNETSIKNCKHNRWGMHDCDPNEAVGILCRDLANTDLRLTDGGFHNQGRLEIFYRGQWGTVCDDGWDDKDATVACRMLGFMYGKARIAATFGQGSGPIWLDDVRCKGNETNIEDCQHGGWGRENCSHDEDAGVVCQ
ncbi:hypothetical protein CHS0354_033530 [Potamilus streckersoni]|uniref:SRCR domain-containing protein n=1 Tax=Potamilus streckersoni TaxID=2493646 RepID=A0AAE0S821_9BIVA|nr:hypothetical protein CHS0354_033530 [Potamilus streckersoni]